MFPNRDYLIVIDQIDGGTAHKYTNQLHLGAGASTIESVGTLTLNDNSFVLQTPNSVNFYGYFIHPTYLTME